jgi:outer membrane biosynthesis protein TonB
LTIVSTGSSGGGLPDFGVFSDEKVYTVYINMRQTTDDPAPSWTLQYALLREAAQAGTAARNGQSSQGLVPPFPVVKEPVQFPIGLVFRHLRSMMVIYAVINKAGKLERMRVVQTPSDELNQPLLDALAKWSFRPAELYGEPVSVKALLGVPLSLSE